MNSKRIAFLQSLAGRAFEAVFLVEALAVLFILTFGMHQYQILGITITLREIPKPLHVAAAAFVLRSLLCHHGFWLFRLLAWPLRWCLAQLGVLEQKGLSFRDGARAGFATGIALGTLGAIQYRYALPTFGAQALAVAGAGLAGASIAGLWVGIFYHCLKLLTSRAERICLALTFSASALAVMGYFQHWEAWGTEPMARNALPALGIAGLASLFFFRIIAALLAKKRYPAAILLLILAVAALSIPSWRSRQTRAKQAETASRHHRRIMFITIDTLRADHLSCYGYPKPTSPVLDRLAATGLRFTQSYCPMSQTDPSHLAMLTGYYPRTLGVPQNGPPLAKKDVPSLPRFFQQKGFATGAIVSRAYLAPSSLELPGSDTESEPSPRLEESRADEAFRRAANWLTDHYDQDFFLWVHFFDPHSHYDPPPQYAKKFTDHYNGSVQARSWLREGQIYTPEELAYRIALYDGEIAYTDETLGRLLEFLNQLLPPSADPPLILVVADHGEMLGELQHQYGFAFGHGQFLYQPLAHVPLIISWPGHLPSARVISGQVDLVDLAPTLVDLLFPGEHFPCQGQSFAPALLEDKPWPRLVSFSQRRFWANPPQSWLRGDQYMVKRGNQKLIYGTEGSRELYDLELDPNEKQNLAGDRKQPMEELFQIGRDWESRTPFTPPRYKDIDPVRTETFRGLGYIQ